MTKDQIQKLIDDLDWSGSWFPVDDCFAKLKGQVPSEDHGTLRTLLTEHAAEYNSHLE